MHVEFSGCKTCLNHSPEDENPLLFTGVLQFFCAALQSCGSPNLKEKTLEKLKLQCVCLFNHHLHP